MLRIWPLWIALACLACFGDAALEPEAAGPDFALQGEYAGAGWGAQVVALGDGAFRAVLLRGGLPGAGATGERWEAEGTASEVGGIAFRGKFAVDLTSGTSEAEPALRGTAPDGNEISLVRAERTSPTQGEKPPGGAILFFAAEGDAAANAAHSVLPVGARTERKIGSGRLHVEFRTPFMPDARGQWRGNSGVYLQDRYELQVLDSFGNAPAANECGAVYEQRAPDVAMAFPPLSWQTYDIEFREARFDARGKKREPARISVRHNGVSVHDDVVLEGPTGQGDPETPDAGPLYLQNHGNPVVFRNVWFLPEGASE